MKNAVLFVITIMLCLASFGGCVKDATEVDAQEAFCYVRCLREDGIVVEIPDKDLGYVYVKYSNADLAIEPLDTVVIAFSDSDLKPVNGKFTDYFGKERIYSYTLEDPQNIRLPDPAIGEPTFG